MGGLAGWVSYGAPPDRAQVDAMSARLAHRGPDGAGVFAEGPACLAHRLRKVSPNPSVQPLVAPDAVVLLDGWIYDHLEVVARAGMARPSAEARHHPDYTASGALPDTVALLTAWRAWGPEFAAEIDGEFAAAIWDRRAQRLHLARDRMGTRPLFWSRRGDQLGFASELPALQALPWLSTRVARAQLSEYLAFQVVHAPRTLLEDVWQVEPAHVVSLDAGGVRARPYWRMPWSSPHARDPADADRVDELQRAVDRAVARRVDPRATTGLYLSGGVGSTAIAIAVRERFLTVPTFTLTFADDPHPESPIAGRVARLLGLENREVVVGTADIAAAFGPAVRALGHPVGHPAVIAQWLLARAARERVRVVLAGDGGEELFGGRFLDRLVAATRTARRLSRLPGPFRRIADRVFRDGAHFSGPPPQWLADLGFGGMGLFSTDARTQLLRDPGLVRAEVAREVLEPVFDGVQTDPVNAAIHGVLRSALTESTLTRADRTAAASGLDVRFPLLDRDVVERMAQLPGSTKVRRAGGTLATRWALRAMITGAIPSALVNRPKRGLPIPLDAWLAGPGRLFLEDRFARLKRDPSRLWQPGALDALRAGVGQPGDAARKLWSLFLLDAWLHPDAG